MIVWDFEKCEQVKSISCGKGMIRFIKTLKGRLIAGFRYGSIKIYDPESWECIKTFENDEERLMIMTVFNGKLIASFCKGIIIKIRY